MARDRMELHDILVDILGSKNVYYCPPNGYQMSYPCIVYQPSFKGSSYADNKRYIVNNRYSITVIDKDPDSRIADRVLDEIPSAYSGTFFTVDNLNHWPIELYF